MAPPPVTPSRPRFKKLRNMDGAFDVDETRPPPRSETTFTKLRKMDGGACDVDETPPRSETPAKLRKIDGACDPGESYWRDNSDETPSRYGYELMQRSTDQPVWDVPEWDVYHLDSKCSSLN